MRYARPEGTFDVLPPIPFGRPETRSYVEDASKWQWVETTFRDLCRLWNIHEARTPVFEKTELFHRAVGDGTDIVTKETYDFQTRGGDSMTLRPEGTAGTIRAFVSGNLHTLRPVTKLFYIGPNFRYERPQKGRYRQHHQAGIEVLGSDDPAVDAEVIALATRFYQQLGLRDLTVRINSVGTAETRAAYLCALRHFAEPLLPRMSDDNRRRFDENPLRMLDSKDARDIALLENAPSLLDFLDDDSNAHFETLQTHLSAMEISFTVDPKLVRGFDYYTRTAFEIQSPQLGDKSLGGGGRYNQLVQQMGGPPTPGIGFGLGLERVLLTLEELGIAGPETARITVFLCPLGAAARQRCVTLLGELRAAGIAADMDYTNRRMKVMLEQADAAGARCAVILGDKELAGGVANVRTMATTDQRTVPLDQLVREILLEADKNE